MKISKMMHAERLKTLERVFIVFHCRPFVRIRKLHIAVASHLLMEILHSHDGLDTQMITKTHFFQNKTLMCESIWVNLVFFHGEIRFDINQIDEVQNACKSMPSVNTFHFLALKKGLSKIGLYEMKAAKSYSSYLEASVWFHCLLCINHLSFLRLKKWKNPE